MKKISLFFCGVFLLTSASVKAEDYELFDCNGVQVLVYNMAISNGLSESTAIAMGEAAYHECMRADK